MAQTPKEKVLERIISKLKENVTHSDEFLNSESIDPVNKKIDNLIQSVHSMIEKDKIDQDTKGSLFLVLNGLENIRDNCTYFMNAAARATKDYNTYLYVLESLNSEYSEYSNGGNGVSERTRIVNERASEVKVPNQAESQPAPQPKAKELTVVKEIKERKPVEKLQEKSQEKSGRFKFSFP